MANYSCIWCKHLPMMRPASSCCERGHLVVVKKTPAAKRPWRHDEPPEGFFTYARPCPAEACLDFEDCGNG